MKKKLIERLYNYKFNLTGQIEILEGIKDFPGDDGGKSVDLHDQRLELKKNQKAMVESLIDIVFEDYVD